MAKASAASKYSEITLTKDRDGEEIKVQLEGKTVAFDYYESILSPNVTATMAVVDTGGSEVGASPPSVNTPSRSPVDTLPPILMVTVAFGTTPF